MPRRATRPRYWHSKGGYGCWHQGRQRMLALGELCDECRQREENDQTPKCPPCSQLRFQADLRFAEMIHAADAEKAEDNSLVVTVGNRYLRWLKEKRKKRTWQIAEYVLTRFAEECGHLRIKDLKPFHVEDWLAKMAQKREAPKGKGGRARGWGSSSRRVAVEVVTACLNYAARKGFITKNPISGAVDMPERQTRTKDALVRPGEFQAMLDERAKRYEPRYYPSRRVWYFWHARRYYWLVQAPENDEGARAAAWRLTAEIIERDGIVDPVSILLRVLMHTGARPGEIYNATAADWDDSLCAFVYPAESEPEKSQGFTHKNARKKKDRVVFVSDPELVRVIRMLCVKRPKGPIFLSPKGRPWTNNLAWRQLEALKRKLGLNPAITPYSFRHTSITDMVMAGQPYGLIAEAHGTSVRMIEKHYGHADGHREAMMKWWAQVKQGQAGGTGGGGRTPGDDGPALRVVAGG